VRRSVSLRVLSSSLTAPVFLSLLTRISCFFPSLVALDRVQFGTSSRPPVRVCCGQPIWKVPRSDPARRRVNCTCVARLLDCNLRCFGITIEWKCCRSSHPHSTLRAGRRDIAEQRRERHGRQCARRQLDHRPRRHSYSCSVCPLRLSGGGASLAARCFSSGVCCSHGLKNSTGTFQECTACRILSAPHEFRSSQCVQRVDGEPAPQCCGGAEDAS